MKTPHTQSTVVITTPQQRRVIESLSKKHLEHGGALLAQVFPDGLRMRVLTPAQAKTLNIHITAALGDLGRAGFATSAFDDDDVDGGAAC